MKIIEKIQAWFHPEEPTELLIKTETYISTYGNPYPVKFYVNPTGYIYPCKTCKGISTNRLEIYNHIYEPQGSAYYCHDDMPEPVNTGRD